MIVQKEGQRLTESKTTMKLPREIESGREKKQQNVSGPQKYGGER